MAREHPQRIVNTYWANPLDKECIEKLNKYHPLYNFRMIKMHQCWNEFDIYDLGSIEIIKWATEKEIPIFIHLLSKEQVLKFINVANSFLDTTFIIAHMIGFEEINKNPKNPNVYYDLSAPQLYPSEILKKALKQVDSIRMILGSDTPYGIDNIQKIQNRLRQLSLSNKDLDNIMGDNLGRLLRL